MTELVELYSKGIKKKLENYWAAWLPGVHFAVGDIGTLNGHIFEKVGSLAELKLKYYEVTDTNSTPLDISSESDVAVSFKAAGETNASFAHIGAADAGLKIDFGSQGAFIIQAPETFGSEMGDRLSVRSRIVGAFKNGIWEKDWLVITRVVKATSATVLISRSSNASLELSTKGNLSGVVAPLGAASADISIKHQKGDTLKVIGGKDMTPLFQLSRLKTSFFSPPKLVTKSLRASDPSLTDLTPSEARRGEIEKSLVFEVLEDGELAER